MSELNYLDKIKTAIRTTSTDENLDDELNDLIDECLKDLRPANVTANRSDLQDPLIFRAVKIYCKMSYGHPEEYDRLKLAYDELKAQMGMDSRYAEY